MENGGKVNKPRLKVLIFPGKPSVCLGLGRNGKVAMFDLSTTHKALYGVVHYVGKKPFITGVSLKTCYKQKEAQIKIKYLLSSFAPSVASSVAPSVPPSVASIVAPIVAMF